MYATARIGMFLAVRRVGGGLMLGTSATVPNPYASATDTHTGFLHRWCGKVDVTSAGTQIAEFNAGV